MLHSPRFENLYLLLRCELFLVLSTLISLMELLYFSRRQIVLVLIILDSKKLEIGGNRRGDLRGIAS